jgi:hypothetical protein
MFWKHKFIDSVWNTEKLLHKLESIILVPVDKKSDRNLL